MAHKHGLLTVCLGGAHGRSGSIRACVVSRDRSSPGGALSPPALRPQALTGLSRGPARGGTPWRHRICVWGGPPGYVAARPGSPLLSFLGQGAPRALATASPHTGAVNQPGPPPARRTCCAPPAPRLPRSLWGRQRRKRSDTERVCCLVRETRDTWELAEEACEAGQTPGQDRVGSCQGRAAGEEPGLVLGRGRNSARKQAQPAPLGLHWGPSPAREKRHAETPWSWGGPAGAARGPHHGPGLRTVGWAWGGEPGHLAALTPSARQGASGLSHPSLVRAASLLHWDSRVQKVSLRAPAPECTHAHALTAEEN